MATQFTEEETGPNPHYKVFLRVHDGGGARAGDILTFWIPDSLSFAFNGDWGTPFANALTELAGRTGGAVIDVASAAAGITGRARAPTMLVWQGSSHIEFAFTFELRAVSATKRNVTDKLRALIAYTMPAEDPVGNTGAFLAPLSNYLIDPESGQLTYRYGLKMDLQIGQYLVVPDVVVKAVNPDIPTRYHTSGRPMEANVQVTFSTRYVPSSQEVLKWFIGYPE